MRENRVLMILLNLVRTPYTFYPFDIHSSASESHPYCSVSPARERRDTVLCGRY
jgi:hypothetical protein